MLPLACRSILALGLVASALSAGFFYTYSVSLMPGLAVIDAGSAIRAMQGINAVIRSALFAFAFFGALALPLAAAPLALFVHQHRAALLALGSSLVYGVGVFATTFLVHVPLNEALATVSPATDAAAQVWSEYSSRWTAWNHVRALSAVLAFGLQAVAIVAGN